MRKKIVAAGLAGIGAAAAVAVGTTVAVASPAAHIEHIRFLQTDYASTHPVVIANGPIHAQGIDTQVNAHRDVLAFRGGGLVVRHHAVSSRQTFDPKTCYGRQVESGTYTVVGGDGKYANASGRGIYHLVAQFVGCGMNKPPKLFELEIDAFGPLSF